MIDWHNYGWTILAGTRGRSHPFVELARAYEVALGQAAATAHVTVTRAMARQLREEPYSIRVPILTLHDRPASLFRPLESRADRRALLEHLLPETKDAAADIVAGRMGLIVSSTSWTPDEDFGLLLDALVTYAAASTATNDKSKDSTTTITAACPRPLFAIITGRGPQKAYYEDRMRQLRDAGQLPAGVVRVATAWLSIEDYAALLACADLGVCLHRSSSGVDLPMKVVDMFGAGLPVAAYSAYESFPELVREGENGRGFETAGGLARILARLFDGGGDRGAAELEGLREGARKEGSLRWDDEWDRVLGRVFGVIDE